MTAADGRLKLESGEHRLDVAFPADGDAQVMATGLLNGLGLPACSHPNAVLLRDESGVSCKSAGSRRYSREVWHCPDCGAEWFDAVRWLD